MSGGKGEGDPRACGSGEGASLGSPSRRPSTDYHLLTPAPPQADQSTENIFKATMNMLAAATASPLPYPERCLLTSIGQERLGEFRFNFSTCDGSVNLNSVAAWLTFLSERLASGAVIVTEGGETLSLDAFCLRAGVVALAGPGGAACQPLPPPPS